MINSTIKDYVNKNDEFTSLEEDVYYSHSNNYKTDYVELEIKNFKPNVPYGLIVFIMGLFAIYTYLILSIKTETWQTYVWISFFLFVAVSAAVFSYLRSIRQIILANDYLILKNYKTNKYYWDTILALNCKITKRKTKGGYTYIYGLAIDFINGDCIEFDEINFMRSSNYQSILDTMEYYRSNCFVNNLVYKNDY